MVEGWSLNREQLQDGRAGRAVSSELPAVGDDDLALGFPTAGALALHLPHYVQPLDHAAEHHVLPVQPCCFFGADEELGPVGVGAGVGHGQDAGAGVCQAEVLICKLVAIDGLSSGSVVVGEIATLAHKTWDDAVEAGSLVAESLLPGAESAEVLSSLGHHISTELQEQSSERGKG